MALTARATGDNREPGPSALGQENEDEWLRLIGTLDLAEGFALFVVWMHDGVTEELLTDRLRQHFGQDEFRVVDVAQAEEPFLPWLFDAAQTKSPGEIVAFTRWDHPAVENHAFARLNEHRNEWIDRIQCRHLFFLHGRARNLIRWQAPDVYAVRTGDFYFAPPPAHEVSALMNWVLADGLSTLEPEEYLEQMKIFAADASPTGHMLWERALVRAVDALRLRSCHEEASKLIEEALAGGQPLTDSTRAELILAAGMLSMQIRQFDVADIRYVEAETLYRKVGDMKGLADTLTRMGDLAWYLGQVDAAGVRYRKAERLFREAQDASGLGHLASLSADRDTARRHFSQALALYRRLREPVGTAYTAAYLARLGADSGTIDVHSYAQEARQAAAASGSPQILADIEELLKGTETVQGESSTGSC